MTGKTDYMVIDFRPDGEVNAMHRDSFDLGFLGPQEIMRASDIRFDGNRQLWDIYVAFDIDDYHYVEEATGFKTYEDARRAELCRLLDISPLSGSGRAVMGNMRAVPESYRTPT